MDKLLKIIKGYLISAVLFLIIMLVLSLIMVSTDMSMSGAKWYGCVALTVAALVFGLSAGITFQKRGLITGIGLGALYVCLFIFMVTTLFDSSFYAGITDVRYIIPVLFCGIGGMLGTNLKN
ncbi:MAG: TIGR04086 family membrane protein [Firmicutes bacterium]|nr:TIGR04086 family membrane protein [Bacillota bacterium]